MGFIEYVRDSVLEVQMHWKKERKTPLAWKLVSRHMCMGFGTGHRYIHGSLGGHQMEKK